MERLKNYSFENIKELLIYSINAFFMLSKEIEYYKNHSIKLDNSKIKILVNWKDFVYSEFSNYFTENDLYGIPLNYKYILYSSIIELKSIWRIIATLNNEEKILILDYVNSLIISLERSSSFKFLDKYKDIVFSELWLDIVDKVGDTTNETLALLEVIMLKR